MHSQIQLHAILLYKYKYLVEDDAWFLYVYFATELRNCSYILTMFGLKQTVC